MSDPIYLHENYLFNELVISLTSLSVSFIPFNKLVRLSAALPTSIEALLK